MAKGKRKNLTNRNQDYSPSSERSTPTPPSPGHPNTPEKLDPDLKAYLNRLVANIKVNAEEEELEVFPLKEIKTTHHHQNAALPPHLVPGTPTQPKS